MKELGLTELSHKEKINTNGGLALLTVAIFAGIVIGACFLLGLAKGYTDNVSTD